MPAPSTCWQRPTDEDCRKSAVELVPGKSTASSKAAADLRAPCGGLQSTLRAGGGRTRARSAALEGSSAPMRPYLPAGGGASGSRGGNPPCRRLSCARVLAGGRRAEERLCGCAGCRYRATDCGAGLAILWDASAIELPVRFAHCARRWERISPQAQGTLRGQVHLGSAFRAWRRSATTHLAICHRPLYQRQGSHYKFLAAQPHVSHVHHCDPVHLVEF